MFFFNTVRTDSPLNIIVIYVNCFNQNRVGSVRNDISITPNIDEFSKTSNVFKNFISSATYTAPCIYEFFTGRYCKKKYPVWEMSLREFVFDELKARGYSFYFPYSLFGNSIFPDQTYNEPCFIFEHLTYLHEPYDVEFSYPDTENDIASYHTQKIHALEKFTEGIIFVYSLFPYI